MWHAGVGYQEETIFIFILYFLQLCGSVASSALLKHP